jgi:SAM-dependent methyltransferase
MGLDTELARLLLEAEQGGVRFDQCLTLGRQHYFVGNAETRKLLTTFGKDPSRYPGLFSMKPPRYSEPFWEVLGVRQLQTLDASAFEGATVIHDLNQPVPDKLRRTFDVVLDSGTIEHVFNFPVAISNCMDMVKVGGHLLLFTTANNFFGHGFYQFSPELFYRVLNAPNGYKIERVVAVEYGPQRRNFEVADPEVIRKRVNLINKYPVLLYVQALRLAEVPLFRTVPQQSDYVAMWQEANAASTSSQVRRSAYVGEKLKMLLIEKLPRLARALEAYKYSSWNREFSFRNRQAFRRIR